MSAFGPIDYLRARDLAYAAGGAQGRKGSLGAALGLWQAPTVQDPYQHEPALIAQQRAQERAQQAAGLERQEQVADEERAFGRNVVLEQLRQTGRGELQGERIEAAEARQKTALEASEAALGKRLGSVEDRFAKSEARRARAEAARLAFQKAKAEADRDLKRDQGRTSNYLRFLGVGQAQERLRLQAASQDALGRYRKALLEAREAEAKARGERFDANRWSRAFSQAQDQAKLVFAIGKDEGARAAWVADRADAIYEGMEAGPNAPRPEPPPPAPEPEPEPGFFEGLFGFGGKGGPGGAGAPAGLDAPSAVGPSLPFDFLRGGGRLRIRDEDPAEVARIAEQIPRDVPFAAMPEEGRLTAGRPPEETTAYAEDPATGRRVTLADVQGSDATSRAVTLLMQKPPEARAAALAEMQADPEAFQAAGVDVERVLREAGRL